ncbi:MAG TPA: energy transducer TonB [Opitutaceae bacterium]|nr:energy transducer TonB [Opitutaceae bacterium]
MRPVCRMIADKHRCAGQQQRFIAGGEFQLPAIVPKRTPVKLSTLLLSLGLLCGIAHAQTKPEPPVPIRTVAPDYPQQLKRDGVSGIVVVKVTVDDTGRVADATVEKSTNAGFNTSAVEAVKQWRFKPAHQNGKPVTVRLALPIKFNIES